MRYLKATDPVFGLKRIDAGSPVEVPLAEFVLMGMSMVIGEPVTAAMLVNRTGAVLNVHELLGDEAGISELLDYLVESMTMVGISLIVKVATSATEQKVLEAHGWKRFGTQWVEDGSERACLMLVVDCEVKDTDWVC